ncbi:MAG TPA: rod shape-determining protein MreD [Novosphingobium sp.]|nr:rod shape-determining protein MreD [Novosphingobium sp.]
MRPPLPIPRQLRAATRKRINRAPSPVLALTVPWLLVMLGSLTPTWPLITSAPLIPPLGLMFLIAWLQLRPGIFPAWAGFPLGLFDDLFSGQPFGSAALLWSVTVLLLELQEFRFPWRMYWQDWAVSSGLVASYLVMAAAVASSGSHPAVLATIVPQIALAVLAFPFIGRVAALFDRFRLLPLRDIG